MSFKINLMLSRLKTYFGNSIKHVKRLQEGFTNHVYEFSVKNKKFIYKEYSSDNDNERNALIRIKTPEIILNDSSYRIEEYLEHLDLDVSEHMPEIVEAIKSMHSLDTNGMESFDSFVERLYGEAVTHLKYNSDTKIVEILEGLKKKAKILIDNNKYKPGLSHNDLHANNMLLTKNGVVIIDYELCTTGDILFDIANFFCKTHLDNEKSKNGMSGGYTKKDEKRFLKLYFSDSKVDQMDILNRVKIFKGISHFIWFMWAVPKLTHKFNSNFNCDNYASDRLYNLRELEFVSQIEETELRSLLL
ncbi:putative choline kinase 1 [Nosema granulosis]|uniref:ethanolamine kinase n=1 Tax=Nosema granulosis TaxID=83296 RepID=A0A9P6GZ22_9MICR|nr:putative choline kinase 1 [Nosema granulosis]